MDFHISIFLLERTNQDLSNNIKINLHTAHARNREGKETEINRVCLDGFS